MAETAIILNNSGNDRYAQISRSIIANPIVTNMMKVVINDEAQLENIIQIRNENSFGGEWNRDISLKNYVNAINRSNLILDIPLNPPVTLDGETYFSTSLAANTTMDLIFYYDQEEIASL